MPRTSLEKKEDGASKYEVALEPTSEFSPDEGGGVRKWYKQRRWSSSMTMQMMNTRGHFRVPHIRKGEVE